MKKCRLLPLTIPTMELPGGQADFDFFTSDACKKLLEENHVHVISWKEIKEKLFDKK